MLPEVPFIRSVVSDGLLDDPFAPFRDFPSALRRLDPGVGNQAADGRSEPFFGKVSGLFQELVDAFRDLSIGDEAAAFRDAQLDEIT